MIYTSYRSNVKNIPIKEDTKIILVYRYGPPIENRSDIIQYRDLGPTAQLFTDYSRYKNWADYKIKYIDQLYNNAFSNRQFGKLIEMAKNYNVILICYEKDYLHCHRSLLATELQYSTDIKYIGEWKG
jgi:uncharacterized protein YeaO (DUF488 family)